MEYIFFFCSSLLAMTPQPSFVYGQKGTLMTKIATTEPREGFRLDGKVITELTTVSMITCALKCLLHFLCKSTNVHLAKTENFPIVDVCQLMLDKLGGMDNELVQSAGWIYSDIEVSKYYQTISLSLIRYGHRCSRFILLGEAKIVLVNEKNYDRSTLVT